MEKIFVGLHKLSFSTKLSLNIYLEELIKHNNKNIDKNINKNTLIFYSHSQNFSYLIKSKKFENLFFLKISSLKFLNENLTKIFNKIKAETTIIFYNFEQLILELNFFNTKENFLDLNNSILDLNNSNLDLNNSIEEILEEINFGAKKVFEMFCLIRKFCFNKNLKIFFCAFDDKKIFTEKNKKNENFEGVEFFWKKFLNSIFNSEIKL